jgi:hypothetical protein
VSLHTTIIRSRPPADFNCAAAPLERQFASLGKTSNQRPCELQSSENEPPRTPRFAKKNNKYSVFLCAFAPLRETTLSKISRKGAKAQRDQEQELDFRRVVVVPFLLAFPWRCSTAVNGGTTNSNFLKNVRELPRNSDIYSIQRNIKRSVGYI